MGNATQAKFAGTGVTQAHTWGLFVPMLAVLSPVLLTKYVKVSEHQPLNAVASGFVIATVVYVLLRTWFKETEPLAKAVLAGLLVAEIMVFQSYSAIPSMSTIALFLFLWYHYAEHD